MEKKCQKCAGPLPKASRGRPRTYCSEGCRRAAEYEIRRLSRRIERLEQNLDDMRGEREDGPLDWRGRTRKGRRKAIREGIREAEARLRELLSTEEVHP